MSQSECQEPRFPSKTLSRAPHCLQCMLVPSLSQASKNTYPVVHVKENMINHSRPSSIALSSSVSAHLLIVGTADGSRRSDHSIISILVPTICIIALLRDQTRWANYNNLALVKVPQMHTLAHFPASNTPPLRTESSLAA